MGIEYLVLKKQQKDSHHFNEAVANLNVGIAERLTDLFSAGLFYFIFDYLYRHFAIFDLRATAINWILLFLATDLLWYWYHRFGHKVNIFWGFHVVHHQSEDFNYTTSVRITVLQAFARGLFWCLLPVLGFPPHMIIVLLLIHGAYPFFTHTEAIGRLGVLEYFLVTPSHHRVHHSSNPEYLDKNYGDVLIIWDKLFGTFAKEEKRPVYGLTTPLGSYSFLWQHFHFLLELSVAFRRAKGAGSKLKVLFGRPDDIDPRIRPALEKRLKRRPAPIGSTNHLRLVIVVQTSLTVILLFLILFFEAYLSSSQLLAGAVFVMISLINTGAMLEQKKWVVYLDFIRLILVGIIVYTFVPNKAVLEITAVSSIVIVLFYKTCRQVYINFLYPC